MIDKEERALISLDENLFVYQQLRGIGQAGRANLDLSEFGGPTNARMSEALIWVVEQRRLGRLTHQVDLFQKFGKSALMLDSDAFPTADPENPQWLHIDDLIAQTLSGNLRTNSMELYLWRV